MHSDRAGISLHSAGGVVVEQVFPCSPWRAMLEQLGVQTAAVEKPTLEWADMALRNCSQWRAHTGLQTVGTNCVGAVCGELTLDSGKVSEGRSDTENHTTTMVVVHRLTTNSIPPSSCRGGERNQKTHNEGGKWSLGRRVGFIYVFVSHCSTLIWKYLN